MVVADVKLGCLLFCFGPQEVLAENVLLPLANLLSDPDYFNGTVVMLVSGCLCIDIQTTYTGSYICLWSVNSIK